VAYAYQEMIRDRINKEHHDEETKASANVTKQKAALEKRTEEKVIKALDESAQATPIPSELVKKGNEPSEKGMYQEANRRYDLALKIKPFNYFHNDLFNYGAAMEPLDKAIEQNPNDANAWYEKGLAP
jgi:tetratricopeptide (TPR) repeat protein